MKKGGGKIQKYAKKNGKINVNGRWGGGGRL
jgi:ribosomal protein S2